MCILSYLYLAFPSATCFCSGLFWPTQFTADVVQTLTLSKARSGCSNFSPPFLPSGSFNLKVHDFSKQLCNQGWSGGVAFSQILIELKCLLGCFLSRQLVAFYFWFPTALFDLLPLQITPHK